MKLLQELREITGFTKDEVAEEFDISLAEYENLESGEILDEKSECYLKEYMFELYTQVAAPQLPTNYSIRQAFVMVAAFMRGYKFYKNKTMMEWMQNKNISGEILDEQLERTIIKEFKT